jgi:hypothetical protein
MPDKFSKVWMKATTDQSMQAIYWVLAGSVTGTTRKSRKSDDGIYRLISVLNVYPATCHDG